MALLRMLVGRNEVVKGLLHTLTYTGNLFHTSMSLKISLLKSFNSVYYYNLIQTMTFIMTPKFENNKTKDE